MDKVELVAGSLKYLFRAFSPRFETESIFSRGLILIFNTFKTISLLHLSAEPNFLLITA